MLLGMLLKKAMKGNLDIMTPYQNILNKEPLSIDEKCDDFEDEIIQSSVLVYEGEIKNERFK